jgi:CDP-diglyceride synthetase
MYWRYWRRGWWSYLMQLLVNIVGVSICMLLEYMLGNHKILYLVLAITIVLVIITPITGWLFEVFARNSKQIDRRQHTAEHAVPT